MKPMRMMVVVMLAAACGDTDGDAMPEPVREVPAAQAAPAPPLDPDITVVQVELAEWRVTLSSDSVPAGIVSFEIRNAGTMTHGFEIENDDQEWEAGNLEPGRAVTMSVDLPPGTYEVYCPIEAGGIDHEDRGMKTVLRVY